MSFWTNLLKQKTEKKTEEKKSFGDSKFREKPLNKGASEAFGNDTVKTEDKKTKIESKNKVNMYLSPSLGRKAPQMSPLRLKIKVSEKIYQKLKEINPEDHPDTFFCFTELKEKWENSQTQPKEADFIKFLCQVEKFIDRLINEVPPNQSFIEEMNYFANELMSLGEHCFGEELGKKFRCELENTLLSKEEMLIL